MLYVNLNMDPVEGSVSFRGDAEYSEVQKRLEDLEQQLLQFRTKVQDSKTPEADSANLSKEFSSKELDDYELSQDEDEPVDPKPSPPREERRHYEAKVPPLPLSPPQVMPQMPFAFPGFPQAQMFPGMPNFPPMGVPLDPAVKERTRKMLLDQSKLLEDLAKKMKRESAPAQEIPESVARAIAELRSRCERLEADKQRLASQVDRLKQPQDLPEPERPNRLELKQANLEINALRNELENVKLQLSQVIREKERLKAEKEAAEKEAAELRATLAQKSAMMERPSRENTSLQSQIARLQQQNKELLLSYQTLQKEFDQIVVDKKKPQPGLNIFDQSQPYNSESRTQPAKRYERPAESVDIVQNLEAKLAAIQGERQRVTGMQLAAELDRVPDSSQRRADLLLECDILDTNIDSLRQKLRRYRG